jgi:hypothetical protein
MIGTLATPFGGYSTHMAYNTVPRISGQIIINDNILGGTTKEVYLACEVSDFGAVGRSIDASIGTGILNCYFDRSRFKTAVYMPTGRLQLANLTRFDGLLTCNNFSRIQNSQISSGMTITQDIADLQPNGIVSSYFSGTFTGPVSSCRLDGFSNWSFKANGATLAGGATKTIQDDLVP